MGVLLDFRRTRRCASCSIEFRPARPTHRYCSPCFNWHRIFAALARMRAALAEI